MQSRRRQPPGQGESLGSLACVKPARATQRKHLSTNTPNRFHNTRLLIQAPCTSALAPPLSPDLIRATHARPLHPAALASVPFGIVLVRVRRRRLSGESRNLSLHLHKASLCLCPYPAVSPSHALSLSLSSPHTPPFSRRGPLFQAGYTALNWAIINRRYESVKMLLAAPGIDVHLGDKVTRTPRPNTKPPRPSPPPPPPPPEGGRAN